MLVWRRQAVGVQGAEDVFGAELGQGSSGSVHLLSSLHLRDTAIKLGSLDQMRTEATMNSAVSHPHILPVHALLTDHAHPGLAYLVMKRAGPDLYTHLQQARCLQLPLLLLSLLCHADRPLSC